MLWYNDLEAVKIISDTSCGWDEEIRRRSLLRLIRSSCEQ